MKLTDTRTATPDEIAAVRTITFRTPAGHEGVVTGVPLSPYDPCSIAFMSDGGRVRMFSAGCLHGQYVIPTGSTVLRSVPRS